MVDLASMAAEASGPSGVILLENVMPGPRHGLCQ